MSLIPMDAGQKAILPDGVQVDHISENTVGHGIRVRGVSDLTTYPVIVGDIGENIIQSRAFASALALTTGVTANVTASPIVFTAGIWLVSGHIFVNVSTTITSLQGGLSVTSATIPGLAAIVPDSNGQFLGYTLPGTTSGQAQSLIIPTFYLKLSASQTLYLVTQVAFPGSGSVSGFVQGTRIA